MMIKIVKKILKFVGIYLGFMVLCYLFIGLVALLSLFIFGKEVVAEKLSSDPYSDPLMFVLSSIGLFVFYVVPLLLTILFLRRKPSKQDG